MKGNPLDFSFSGLKTAVLRWVEGHDLTAEIEARRAWLRSRPGRPGVEEWLAVVPQSTLDLIASFQQTVITELLTRVAAAAEQIGAHAVIISGGVACNSGLRAASRQAVLGVPVYFPTPALSTDNAAMIAAAAFPRLARGEVSGFTLKAQANLALA
jgi:N6-L-threonylcarbamoyladenine synthase